MKRFESVCQLHRLLLLPNQRPLSLDYICERLECSESTAKRVIRDLRDRFSHPIEYDTERNGYYYASSDGLELPGLWLTEGELTALVTIRELLDQSSDGLLADELLPLGRLIEEILEQAGFESSAGSKRIRILAMAPRHVDQKVFRAVADAVLTRRQIRIDYTPRGREGRVESRLLSPQRLAHYRDNWYLDAYCHAREDLRTFALDRASAPQRLEEAAVEIDDDALNKALRSSYGIFSGESSREAVLRFTARRAQWVAGERWHMDQKGRLLDDGSYELRIPYGNHQELVMDVLRYGADVEVLAPPELRREVAERLETTAKLYRAEI